MKALHGAETARSLDHVGIAGTSLERLAAAFTRMGFTLTPRARHAGRRTPEGPVVPFGTGNRCVMLREGYLELIAVLDASAFTNGLEAALARYEGIHIVALGIEDEEQNLARMRRAGVEIPGVAYLERPVDERDPTGPKARFARLPFPNAPEGRIFLIRHLTPEVIRQERFLAHPNHATALDAVVLAVADPAETARRFSALAGLPVAPDPLGGFVLALPRGRVRLLDSAGALAVFPGLAVPTLPFIAGIVVATDDGNAAIGALLKAGGIPHRALASGLLVGQEDAGGAALLFSPR